MPFTTHLTHDGMTYTDYNSIKLVKPALVTGLRTFKAFVAKYPSVNIIITDEHYATVKLKFAAAKKDKRLCSISDLLTLCADVLPDMPQYLGDDSVPIGDSIFIIKLYGERAYDKLLFNTKNLGVALGLKQLAKDISRTNESEYIQNEDYKIFNCMRVGSTHLHTSRANTTTREYLLTYKGFLKAVSHSRKQESKLFMTWVSKIVHAAHLGSAEDKQDALYEITDAYTPSDGFPTIKGCIAPVSAVYLYKLGTVNLLRDSLNITGNSDSHIVVKFGRTNDLARREKEHLKNTFVNVANVQLELISYIPIPQIYLSKAESSVRTYLLDRLLGHNLFSELAIVAPDDVEDLELKLVKLGRSFSYDTLEYALEEKNQQLADKDNLIQYMRVEYKQQLTDKDNLIARLLEKLSI